MQLEETASSKDVPPLSQRGVFELVAVIAQNNLRPVSLHSQMPLSASGISAVFEPDRNQWKSLA